MSYKLRQSIQASSRGYETAEATNKSDQFRERQDDQYCEELVRKCEGGED